MLGWVEYIGRILSFTIEKVAGKKIDLTLDDRRRAARKFLCLYHAVSDLESLSKEVAVELRAMIHENDPTVSREWLRDISTAIDETSQRFLEATQGLLETLKIFDPTLARTVSGLEAHKFSFLLIAAHGFEPIRDKNEITEIEYTQPSDEANALDLTENYNWYATHDLTDPSQPVEWPSGVAQGFVDETDTKSDRVNLRDAESMNRLANLLDHHVQSLSTARESLAKFLQGNFRFEDLLALQQPISQFDRIHTMKRMSASVGIPYVRMFAGKPPRKFPPGTGREE